MSDDFGSSQPNFILPRVHAALPVEAVFRAALAPIPSEHAEIIELSRRLEAQLPKLARDLSTFVRDSPQVYPKLLTRKQATPHEAADVIKLAGEVADLFRGVKDGLEQMNLWTERVQERCDNGGFMIEYAEELLEDVEVPLHEAGISLGEAKGGEGKGGDDGDGEDD